MQQSHLRLPILQRVSKWVQQPILQHSQRIGQQNRLLMFRIFPQSITIGKKQHTTLQQTAHPAQHREYVRMMQATLRMQQQQSHQQLRKKQLVKQTVGQPTLQHSQRLGQQFRLRMFRISPQSITIGKKQHTTLQQTAHPAQHREFVRMMQATLRMQQQQSHLQSRHLQHVQKRAGHFTQQHLQRIGQRPVLLTFRISLQRDTSSVQ